MLRFFAASVALVLIIPHPAAAISIDLDHMGFTPPNPPINVLEINITTDTIGDDSDTSTVSGFISSRLEFEIFGTSIVPTGLELTGGDVLFEDTNFSFLFGLVTVSSSGLRGVPDTPSPPSAVTSGDFPAADHTLLLNQGVVEAAGQTIDFSLAPLEVAGVGTGQVMVTSNGAPVGNAYSYNATVTLPVEFAQDFTVMDVPIVNTVNGTFAGQGTIQVSQDFTLTLLDGDYNLDGSLDCADLGLLEQAIDTGSTNSFFDANGDGLVNMADETFWLDDLRMALPADANLDDLVDGVDFLIWNARKFQDGTGWCTGDWNQDARTDGQDFVIWNANKFAVPTAVPEPQFAMLGLGWGLLMAFGRRRHG